MKKLVQTIEVENQGLEALLGEDVMLLCLNYIYAGKLVGVNDKDVLLENAHIVYETGAFSDSEFKDAQKLPSDEWRIKTTTIESYGVITQLKK